jgi:flavin-dependent dehydrogenase
LQQILFDAGAVSLESLRLFDDKSNAALPLAGGFSISRDRFDSALISSAISRGAHFLPGHHARVLKLGSACASALICLEDEPVVLQAKVLVVADGLSGHALDGIPGFDMQLSLSSRIGAGTVMLHAPPFYQPGTIYMCCGEDGYVGLVLLEDGRLDVACALDREYSRRMNGPAKAAEKIIASCNLPLPPALAQSRWVGTEALTRTRSCVSGRRLFVVGDACGYAEPFTGEGISWAIWSAVTAAPMVAQAISCWHDGIALRWEKSYKVSIRKCHDRSNIIAAVLRKNKVRSLAISVLSRVPGLVSPLVSSVTGHSMRKGLTPETRSTLRDKEYQWSQ